MTLVEIAIGTMLRIPKYWDRFQYKGRVYRRDKFNRFVIDRKVAA